MVRPCACEVQFLPCQFLPCQFLLTVGCCSYGLYCSALAHDRHQFLYSELRCSVLLLAHPLTHLCSAQDMVV